MKKLIDVDPTVFDSELDYFPLYDGLKPSSMGLKKISKDAANKPREKIFLFGESFEVFRKNKEWCRDHDLSMFYQNKGNAYPEIIKYIIDTLVTQNSEYFKVIHTQDSLELSCLLTDEKLGFNSSYGLIRQETKLKVKFVDAMDALSMQIPEDLVIHHIPNGQLNPLKKEKDKMDYASQIHLCHCNGWNAQWAIGKSFDEIHEGVNRINKIIPNATRMMLSFFNVNAIFERVAAISIKTSAVLNRHDEMEDKWLKPFDVKKPLMHLRVERQTVTGFPKSEAFLFTIRTYLYDLNTHNSDVSSEIKEKRKSNILEMVENPHPDSYAYSVITKHKENLLKWLKS